MARVVRTHVEIPVKDEADGPQVLHNPDNPEAPSTTIPDKPVSELAPEAEELDHWNWLANFPDDEWKFLSAYLYRTDPIINRRAGELNIDIYGRRFDLDDVMKTHGSGGYRCDVNQDSKRGKRTRIRQFYFTIFNPAYPPKIPLGDWADDPRNAKWAFARENAHGGGSVSNGNPEGLIKLVFEQVEKMRPNVGKEDQVNIATQVMQMVQRNQAEMMALADPAKTMSLVMGIVDKIAPKDTGGKNDLLMQMLIDDRKIQAAHIADLTKAMMERPKEKSMIESIGELGGVIESLESIRASRGGSSGGTDWGTVATNVFSELAKIAVPIAAAYMNRPQSGQTTPPATPAPARQALPAARPMERAAAAAAAEAETPPAAAAPNPNLKQPPALTLEEQTRLMAVVADFGAVFQSSIPFLVDGFNAGESGEAFRDWFISRKGSEWWKRMQRELQASDLVLACRYDAQLWNALQPEDELLAFFTEFLMIPQDDEDEDEPEPLLAEPA